MLTRQGRLNPTFRCRLAYDTGLDGINVCTHSDAVYSGKGGSTMRQMDAAMSNSPDAYEPPASPTDPLLGLRLCDNLPRFQSSISNLYFTLARRLFHRASNPIILP